MTQADLERDLANWLRADAAAVAAPDALRRRVLDIPAAGPERRGWFSRYWPVLAAPVAASTAVAGLLASVLVFGLFDAPPGTDGEPCNRRQTQRALDELRGADGYRYLLRTQQSDLDRTRAVSLDDPAWTWVDTTVHEGAYLAPDRFVDRVVERAHEGDAPLERRQTDAGHWELWELDGAQTWVEHDPWPTANVAWGYVENAMPTAMIPAVSTLGFGEAEIDLADDLPGTGGCIAVAKIPEEQAPEDAGGVPVVPDGMVPTRYLALRVDPAGGLPVSVLLGPGGPITRQGLTRTTIELTWERPDPAELTPPGTAIPDPWASAPPPPEPTPIVIGEDAWAPTLLDGSADWSNLSDMTTAGSRIVTVGAQHGVEASTWRGEAWTSDDGQAWTVVHHADWERTDLVSVASSGTELLAIALQGRADGTVAEPEAWRSADGIAWERVATLHPDVQPSRLVAGGPGWVLTGSAATNDIQMRPAIWTSSDGRRWEEAELEGTASGRLGPIAVTSSGELIATGCESPDDPDGPQSGSGVCFSRLWRSTDGTTWQPDPIAPIAIDDLVAVPGGLLAIGSDPTEAAGPEQWLGAGALWWSADGDEWTIVPGLAADDAAPNRLYRIGDEIVVTGSRMNVMGEGGYPVAFAWRSTDRETWEPIELGLPDEGVGSQVVGAFATADGLAFVGNVLVSEAESVPAVWHEP